MRLRDADVARLAEAVRPVPAEVQPSWMESQVRRRMLIHTTDDLSIEGLVTLVTETELVLYAARLMSDKPVKLDGEVWIPREKVRFVQTVRM